MLNISPWNPTLFPRKLFWNSNTDDRDELYNFEVYNGDEDEDEL